MLPGLADCVSKLIVKASDLVINGLYSASILLDESGEKKLSS
jgi:hypothetical protein